MRGSVSIVLVSHSSRLAEGAAEMARQIGSADIVVLAVGGTDGGDLGTSAARVEQALTEADQGAGVVVLPDLGSSVLTTRAVLEDREQRGAPHTDIVLVDTAFVEGAVAAAVTAATGASLDEVVAAAEEARHVRKL
jgi:phosphoenolpyruvate---glycerone phosphotransferase subunit DhaM